MTNYNDQGQMPDRTDELLQVDLLKYYASQIADVARALEEALSAERKVEGGPAGGIDARGEHALLVGQVISHAVGDLRLRGLLPDLPNDLNDRCRAIVYGRVN